MLCCLQFGLYLLHYACIGHFNSQIELLIKFCSTSSPTETISKFYVGLAVCSIYIFLWVIHKIVCAVIALQKNNPLFIYNYFSQDIQFSVYIACK